MPIVGRTPRECFNQFADHLRELVAKTVTSRHPLVELPGKTKTMLSFREGDPIAVPIQTAYERLFFYLGQALEVIPDENRGYRLTTSQYWYRVQHKPALTTRATLRWEYTSSTPTNREARHHVQMAAALSLGDRSLDLDRAHVPTGWVTIEEVIRFLIVDLGVAPPCGDTWPDELGKSERRFYEEFTGKRYKPLHHG